LDQRGAEQIVDCISELYRFGQCYLYIILDPTILLGLSTSQLATFALSAKHSIYYQKQESDKKFTK